MVNEDNSNTDADEALLRARTQLPDGSYIYGMNEVTLDNVADFLLDLYIPKGDEVCAPLHQEYHEKSGRWRTRKSMVTEGSRADWFMRISSEKGRRKSTQDFFDDRMEY